MEEVPFEKKAQQKETTGGFISPIISAINKLLLNDINPEKIYETMGWKVFFDKDEYLKHLKEHPYEKKIEHIEVTENMNRYLRTEEAAKRYFDRCLQQLAAGSKIRLSQMKESLPLEMFGTMPKIKVKFAWIDEKKEAFLKIDDYINSFNEKYIDELVAQTWDIDLLNTNIQIYRDLDQSGNSKEPGGSTQKLDNKAREYFSQFSEHIKKNKEISEVVKNNALLLHKNFYEMFPDKKSIKKADGIYRLLQSILPMESYELLEKDNNLFDEFLDIIQKKKTIFEVESLKKIIANKEIVNKIQEILAKDIKTTEEQVLSYVKEYKWLPIRLFYMDNGAKKYYDMVRIGPYQEAGNQEINLLKKYAPELIKNLFDEEKKVLYMSGGTWDGVKDFELFQEWISQYTRKFVQRNGLDAAWNKINGTILKNDWELMEFTRKFREKNTILFNDTSLVSLLTAKNQIDELNGRSLYANNTPMFFNQDENFHSVVWLLEEQIKKWELMVLTNELHKKLTIEKGQTLPDVKLTERKYKVWVNNCLGSKKISTEDFDICIHNVRWMQIGGFCSKKEEISYIKELFQLMKWKQVNKLNFTAFRKPECSWVKKDQISRYNWEKTELFVKNTLKKLWLSTMQTKTHMENWDVNVSVFEKEKQTIKLEWCWNFEITNKELSIHKSKRFSEDDIKRLAEKCWVKMTKCIAEGDLFLVEFTKNTEKG